MFTKMKNLLAVKVEAARKRGVTLIEAVLFIVIALALIVGGIVFFNQASLAQRTTDSIRSVVGIQSETRGLFQSSADFGTSGSVLNGTLISAGAVPSNLILDATATPPTLSNSWGGLIDVVAEVSQFTVTFNDVPSTACARMVSFDATGNGIAGTGIDGVSIAAAGGTLPTPATSLTPAQAAAACGTSGDTVIEWTFGR